MKINILNRHRSRKIPSGRIRRVLQSLAPALKINQREVTVVFVSDRQILRLNKRYLGHGWATDVLAFPLEEVDLGDIVVSLDRAARQAKEEGHSRWREIQILVIHGLLHLLGFSDKRPAESRRMWKKTEELLRIVERVR